MQSCASGFTRTHTSHTLLPPRRAKTKSGFFVVPGVSLAALPWQHMTLPCCSSSRLLRKAIVACPRPRLHIPRSGPPMAESEAPVGGAPPYLPLHSWWRAVVRDWGTSPARSEARAVRGCRLAFAPVARHFARVRWRRAVRSGCAAQCRWCGCTGSAAGPLSGPFAPRWRGFWPYWRWAARPAKPLCGGVVGLRVWLEHLVLRPEGPGRGICARPRLRGRSSAALAHPRVVSR